MIRNLRPKAKQLSQAATNRRSRSAVGMVHRPLGVESLETRTMLAGDVAVSLDAHAEVLTITGEGANESILVRGIERLRQDSQLVTEGKTSVFLDFALLEQAAGLVFDGANGTVSPVPGNFQVAFPIEPTTDFEFRTDQGFTPVAGLITHSGSVSFLLEGASIVVGDFAIGFDGSRVSDSTSGFYVKDTISGLGILFDVGIPGIANFSDPELTIGEADLLVSPEFSAALAGDDSLAGADVGDAQIDASTVLLQVRRVNDGTTSVFLDLDLLATVGLTDPAIDSPGSPVSNDFQVGFPITGSSSFEFSTLGGLTPLGGQIEHVGTVSFSFAGSTIVVGDFSIGFDAGRAGDGASGFFVEDTVSDLGILFDVGVPGHVAFHDPALTVADADLLASPEFSEILVGDTSLAGVPVGRAQIDALTSLVKESLIQVRGLGFLGGRTDVNGQRTVEFRASDVASMVIDLGAGRDSVRVWGLSLAGDLSIDLGSGSLNRADVARSDVAGLVSIVSGSGRDRVQITDAALGELLLDTGDGRDFAYVKRVRTEGGLTADLGGGWDRLTLVRNHIGGDAELNGGSGFDRLDAFFNEFGGLLDYDRFQHVRIR